MDSEKPFNFILPAQFTKSDNGEWKIMGLASTAAKDLQGEVIDQSGLDLTPIDMKKGILNWDHKKGPENTIGVIDSYKKAKEGLYLSGRLFKNHSKAKAVYEIMSSLNKADTGRMGMSVEGVIKERAGRDGKVIKKAVIHSCALTMNPVNTDTYASLIKSLTEDSSDLEFSKDEDVPQSPIPEDVDDTANSPMFSANQVLAILEKALGTGAGALGAPNTLTGGDAMKIEADEYEKKKKLKKDLELPLAITDSSPNVKPTKMGDSEDDVPKNRKVNGHNVDNGGTENGMAKTLKPLKFDLFKSHMFMILNNLQALYPEYTRSEIWECVKDRLEKKFPELKHWEN